MRLVGLDFLQHLADVRRDRLVIEIKQVAQSSNAVAPGLDQLLLEEGDRRGIVVAQEPHDRVLLEHVSFVRLSGPARKVFSRPRARFCASTVVRFENDRGQSAVFGMAETDPDVGHFTFVSHLLRAAAQDDEWLAAFSLLHVEIAPPHRLSDPGPEGFRKRFLGRKARREMARGKFHRVGISDLALGEDAVQKTVAETLDRILDPRAIDQVDTNADDSHPL